MLAKLKRISVGIGRIVASFLLLGPIIIISMNDKLNTQEFWILLIASMFYDCFLYSIIKQDNYIQESKKLFENVYNGKTINSKTIEEKQKWYEVICIDMFMNFFNDNKK